MIKNKSTTQVKIYCKQHGEKKEQNTCFESFLYLVLCVLLENLSRNVRHIPSPKSWYMHVSHLADFYEVIFNPKNLITQLKCLKKSMCILEKQTSNYYFASIFFRSHIVHELRWNMDNGCHITLIHRLMNPSYLSTEATFTELHIFILKFPKLAPIFFFKTE